jgi:hypothetical protein
MKTVRTAVLDELLALIRFYRDGSYPETVLGIHPRVSAEVVVSLVHASMIVAQAKDDELDHEITAVDIDARGV